MVLLVCLKGLGLSPMSSSTGPVEMITCHHLTESRDLSLTLSKGSFVIRFCELYKGLSQGFCFC